MTYTESDVARLEAITLRLRDGPATVKDVLRDDRGRIEGVLESRPPFNAQLLTDEGNEIVTRIARSVRDLRALQAAVKFYRAAEPYADGKSRDRIAAWFAETGKRAQAVGVELAQLR